MTKARDIADGVDTADIADGAISTAKLADGSISTAKIADTAISAAKIADNSINATKLDVSGNGTAGQVLKSDGDGSFTWVDTADPFSPTTVSGTTPSLDLGTYNFFSQGTLTGDTTVSFANTPTNKRFFYDFAQNGDVSGGDVVDTYGVQVQSGSPYAMYNSVGGSYISFFTFANNGTKAYSGVSTVYEYDLSTSWNVSTATYTGNSRSLTTTASRYIHFRPDGLQFFIAMDSSTKALHTYTMTTAWDVSTASYTRSINAPRSGNPTWAFSNDGTKLYFADFDSGGTSTGVTQWTLSTAWNTGTASTTATRNYSSMNLSSFGFTGNDGFTQMYVTGDGASLFAHTRGVTSNAHRLLRLDMSTPFAISTAYMTTGENRTGYGDPMYHLKYYPFDGVDEGYLGRQDNYTQTIYTYDARNYTPYTLTLPASVQNSEYATDMSSQNITSKTDRRLYEFVTTDGGTNVWLVGNTLYDNN